MLERVKSLPDVIVLNDEAHHVHDDDLAWNKSLLAVHDALPNGIGAWLDFSATPKDQNGMYFPWTVVDYPLAQAVEDRIVKAPLIVTNKQKDAAMQEWCRRVERECGIRWRYRRVNQSEFDPRCATLGEVVAGADAPGMW